MTTEIQPDIPLKDGARGRKADGRWYTIREIGFTLDSRSGKGSGVFFREYDDGLNDRGEDPKPKW